MSLDELRAGLAPKGRGDGGRQRRRPRWGLVGVAGAVTVGALGLLVTHAATMGEP